MGVVRRFSAIFLTASALQAVAHEPVAVAPKDLYRPTPMPDRIVLTWIGDPARSQAVTWRTDASVKHALAQWAPAEPNSTFVNNAKTVSAATQRLETDLSVAHYHTVEFVGLTPKSEYLYRVGDGANWSEWFLFRTASDKAEPFRFVYFGDAQNDLRQHWSRVVREAARDAPRAAFYLHAGDLVNKAHDDAEWGEWHQAGGWLNAMTPSIPVVGNHEYKRVAAVAPLGYALQLSKQWRPQFALPANGPKGLEETVYALDYQGVRVVALNSNFAPETQADWLKARLRNNPCRWTIAAFHHPVYSAARKRDNPKLRDAWQPIFDEYKVDLVLTGHDHTYARSGLMTYQKNAAVGAWTRGAEGTVYVTSVSGPKWYVLDREDFMVRAAEATQLYQIVGVDGDELQYEARTALGKPYDGFTLRKRAGLPNELIEQVPDAPERRAPPKSK
jgi:hypothetical protein